MGKIARPVNLAIYSALRPRQSRSRNGCLQCRVRRKKCGEERPLCQSCLRLKVPCVWPGSPACKKSAGGSAAEARSTRLPCVDGRQTAEASSAPGARSRPNEVDRDEVGTWLSEDGFQEALQSPSQLAALEDLGQYLRQLDILPGNGSPATSLGGAVSEREGAQAGMLFDHFCHSTIPWLFNSDRHDYLVLKHIVPLAVADTLVLHAVLATSGIHFQCSMPSIETEALRYYTSALSRLNRILSDRSSSQAKDYKIVLTTMILLCHFEIIDSNTHGAALQHVHGCREFVHLALEHLNDPDHEELVVLLVENYGFFSLIANVSGAIDEENIRLGLEFSASILPLIKNMPSFGSMLSTEPEGIYLTPLIARVSRQKRHGGTSSIDQDYHRLWQALQNSARHLEPPSGASGAEMTDVVALGTMQVVKAIKTTTLMIVLQASFYQADEDLSATTVRLQPLVDRAMALLAQVEAKRASYGLFWCFLVLGAFLRDEKTQELLVQHLTELQSGMPLQRRAVELLTWLWKSPEGAEFGLAGLEKVALAHGANSFMC